MRKGKPRRESMMLRFLTVEKLTKREDAQPPLATRLIYKQENFQIPSVHRNSLQCGLTSTLTRTRLLFIMCVPSKFQHQVVLCLMQLSWVLTGRKPITLRLFRSVPTLHRSGIPQINDGSIYYICHTY